MIMLRALKVHRYGRERLNVGDEYVAPDKDARVLIAAGLSAAAEPRPVPRVLMAPVAQAEEAPAEQPTRQRRRYARRDMAAES